MNNNSNYPNNQQYGGQYSAPQYGQQPVNQQPAGQQYQYGSQQYVTYTAQPRVQTAPVINLSAPAAAPAAKPAAAAANKSGSGDKQKFILGIVIGVIACVIIGAVAGVVANAMRGDSSAVSEETSGLTIDIEESPVTQLEEDVTPDDTLTYAQIAHKVRSAVVGVTVYSTSSGWGSYAYSEGTGFIISDDGYIVTNSHVIGDDENYFFQIAVTITDENGESNEYEAEVIGYDTRTDIAVLKINASKLDLNVVEFGDSAALVPGDEVVAIGNPGGSQFAGSVTNGIVSGIDRVIDGSSATSESAMKYIQTNAAINPGNSGGPLLNMYGQVIGINTSKIVADGYEGLGFAIPMATAKPIIESLIRDGMIIRPILGISCSELSEQVAQWYDVPQGLLIKSISENSDLLSAGVEEGDIITKCDGVDTHTVSELQSVIEAKDVGDEVTLTIFRRGRATEFEVTVKLISDKS